MELSKAFPILGIIWVLQIVRTSAQGCQRTINITESITTLSSDNYGTGQTYLPYTWCRYIINGPTDRNVWLNITFKDFDLENSAACTADSFKIFDLARPGVEELLEKSKPCRSSPLQSLRPAFGPHCGNATPPIFTSKSSKIAIDFCSDYGSEGRGWRIQLDYIETPVAPVNPPCGRTIELTRLGQVENITSPNYPSNYNDLQNCTWTIRANKNYPLRLDARNFNLGTSTCDDKLVVTDVTNNNITHLYCGTNAMLVLTLEDTEEVTVEFQADAWDAYSGFWIDVSLVPCKIGLQACDNFVGCVNVSHQCDGVVHCSDGSDENPEYCAPDCGVSHFKVQDQLRIVGVASGDDASIRGTGWYRHTHIVRDSLEKILMVLVLWWNNHLRSIACGNNRYPDALRGWLYLYQWKKITNENWSHTSRGPKSERIYTVQFFQDY